MIADKLTKALLWQQHKNFIKLIRLDNITDQIQYEKRMKALRDKMKNSEALETASKSAKMIFFAYKNVKMRGAGQNYSVYRDLALWDPYS